MGVSEMEAHRDCKDGKGNKSLPGPSVHPSGDLNTTPPNMSAEMPASGWLVMWNVVNTESVLSTGVRSPATLLHNEAFHWRLQVRMKTPWYQYRPQISKVYGCRTSCIWASKGAQGWQPARTLVGANDVFMGDSGYNFNQQVQRQAFAYLSKPTCSIHSVLTNPGFAPFQGILGSGLSPCTTQIVICSQL